MKAPFFNQDTQSSYLLPAMITGIACITLLTNAIGIMYGVTEVLSHLIYIPIILSAYYYPRRGIPAAVIIALVYGGMTIAFQPGTRVMIAVLYQSIMFMVIGAILSILCSRLHRDTQKEARLAAIIESSGDAIIAKNLDGIITDWNPGAETTYGYHAAEVIGKSVSILLPPDRPEDLQKIMERIKRGDSLRRYETQRKTKDNRIIDVSLSVSPIKDIGGEVIGASVTSHDITIKKQLERQVLNAKNEWERTFYAVTDMIAIVGTDLKIQRVNTTMADRLGVSPEKIVGSPVYDILRNPDLPTGPDFQKNILRDGKTHTWEIHDDNFHGDFLVTVSPIRDNSGTITGHVLLIHDITANKAARREIEEHHNFLERLLETISNPIFYKDINGVYTGCNSAFEQYLGKNKEEILGKTVYELAPGDLADIYSAKDKELFDNPGTQTYESEVRYADGTIHDVIFSKSTFASAEGTIDGLVGIITDISERKKMEMELKDREAQLNEAQSVARIGSWQLDPETRRIKFSQELLEIFGFSQDTRELVLDHILAKVHPEDRPRLEIAIRNAIITGDDSLDLHISGEDHATRIIHVIGHAQKAPNRQTPFLLGTAQDITERKAAENQILEALGFNKAVLENSPVGIVVYIESGSCISANPAAGHIFGTNTDTLLTQNFHQMESWKHSGLYDLVTSSIASRKTQVKEILIKTFDKERWLEVICTTFLSADDIHILLMYEDITDRKETELALQQYADEISDLYNNAPCGYHSLDPEGVIVRINDTELNWIGYSGEEIIGKKKFTDLITDESRIKFRENYPRFKENGFIKDLEFDMVRKDGSILPILVSAMALKDHDGNFLMSRSTLFDITERKQIEETLKKSEERLSLALRGANEGLWEWNIATREVYFSPRWKSILGYTDDEINPVAQDWEDLIFDDDRDQVNMIIMDYLAGKTDKYEVEFRMVHKDGHLVHILSRAFLVRRDSDGKPIRLVGTHSDITERKQAEEALFLANKKINMLSSITRHDILNQVMGLRTYIALTKDMTPDTELLGYIDKEDEIADAIQRQIEFTRYYQDIGVQAPTWQDAGTIINNTTGELDLTGIRFENTVTGIEISADPLIEKVFYNLVENTLRHGEHVTAISFSDQVTDEGLIIAYRDDGVGISAEDKARLFQRGFGKHTGLGLFLSREILSITGIAIRENGEPGKGVNFEIVVPNDRYRKTK